MRYLLGIDLGSSSVKVSLVDAESGECKASAHWPESEAPIKALQPGWAEQCPDDWWSYFKHALAKLTTNNYQLTTVQAIGISYQMHGLVCLDKNMQPLRDAIIWCDSRGVPYGQHAPNPGNFTASKLAWVKEHEPDLFDKIRYIMLPGDYLALRLTGTPATTACGLSEMMLWDFGANAVSSSMMEYFGFPMSILPPLVPTFGEQGQLSDVAAKELGLKAGIPVTYRAGDQPNNALSLNVFNSGEIAATAGTSGVVYGVSDKVSYDPLSRVNTFLHVNHNLGILLCINGCGILNSWLKHNVTFKMDYDEINRLAATVPAGSEGVSIIPFGNGAERVLENSNINCSVHGLNFNRHTQAHLLRAAQEGVVFAFMYGMEVMKGMGMNIDKIHAGKANMFLSPIFREMLSNVSGAVIELYDTDGSIGAARAAGLGARIYTSTDEAFSSLKSLLTIEPLSDTTPYREAYEHWKTVLNSIKY